jgi:hypothetical protein
MYEIKSSHPAQSIQCNLLYEAIPAVAYAAAGAD